MFFYILTVVAGIMVGLLLLAVIFSLLTMAQRGDDYLEQIALRRAEPRRAAESHLHEREVPLKRTGEAGA